MGEKADQVKGRVKQAAGDLTDDDRLKTEGKIDEVTGRVKEKAAQAADKVREKVKDALD
jgi:uncharacterized protein YjbJ (UPF0337 family)